MRRSFFFCKRLAGVLNQDFRHQNRGEMRKNSREHLFTNKTIKEQFKRSAVRKGDVNNHISEHRRLTNHNIVWDSPRLFRKLDYLLKADSSQQKSKNQESEGNTKKTMTGHGCSDERLTLETSALTLETVVNLRYQLS